MPTMVERLYISVPAHGSVNYKIAFDPEPSTPCTFNLRIQQSGHTPWTTTA